MDNLYVVMPAYNEEENIENVVKAWYTVLSGKNPLSKLVVADSGSTDTTHERLLKLKETYPQLETYHMLYHCSGFAITSHFSMSKNSIIFQTDSDGQTDPEEFEEFWNLRMEYDGVFGHRKVRGDGKSRAVVEHVVCFLVWMYFGVKVPDANAPFRLLKVDTVKKYLYRMREDYNLPNIMMTTWFAYYGEKIVFKEVSFKPRQAGVNSINIPKIVKIGWQALKDFKKFKQEMKR